MKRPREDADGLEPDRDVNIRTTVLLVRHGARQDYANPSWRVAIRESGGVEIDPPLSPLGHQQAREVGKALLDIVTEEQRSRGEAGVSEEHEVKLMVSPYLRVIQTAAPFADRLIALQAQQSSGERTESEAAWRAAHPMCVEPGIAEIRHVPKLPSQDPKARFPYFPQVDAKLYQPAIDSFVVNDREALLADAPPCEKYPEDYFERMRAMAQELDVNERYRGNISVFFSHAASSALVAHLLRAGCLRDEVGAFAPCGIWHLERTEAFERRPPLADGCKGGHSGKQLSDSGWTLKRRGEDNSGHVTENVSTTQPWMPSEAHLHLYRERYGKAYAEKRAG